MWTKLWTTKQKSCTFKSMSINGRNDNFALKYIQKSIEFCGKFFNFNFFIYYCFYFIWGPWTNELNFVSFFKNNSSIMTHGIIQFYTEYLPLKTPYCIEYHLQLRIMFAYKVTNIPGEHNAYALFPLAPYSLRS